MKNKTENMDQKFILLHTKDNTITALRDLSEGDALTIEDEGKREQIILRENVAYAHKAARNYISKGADVFKYGEVIGIATDNIEPGNHVHVHNVDSKRAKKDGS
ncbi:MAG TPA: UxaA family hydrolase [Deltaproteobacteria bacterium]|nr:UxaA family hydrolase [Deltaproteobacteria bacterium]